VTPDTAIPPPESRRATPAARPPASLYACLYHPPAPDVCGDAPRATLELIAREFSPRYERHHDTLISIDVSGLDRIVGKRALHGPLDSARVIGEELHREAAARGVRVHVAVAGTRMAALVLAIARPGVSPVSPGVSPVSPGVSRVSIVAPGDQAAALAAIPIGVLPSLVKIAGEEADARAEVPALPAFKRWGLKTLGDLAALPRAELTARLGRQALGWQTIARGEDIRPLVPTLDEERFEASLDLDWPIDGLEPLSFVLTRLLEPLSTRLERRDRGTAVLHVVLRLVTREPYARRLELPSPLRDVRTLRTLALLDLESHPPDAAIDRVSVIIDPTPGRILQHTLFTRAHPTPEQLSTLLARLGALMGQDRLGRPAVVDSYRPGAFAMAPFATDHDERPRARGARTDCDPQNAAGPAVSAVDVMSNVVSALRRCRHPVPARVAVDGGRPVRVTTDRRGFAGGTVIRCVGPWRSSGNWWERGPEGVEGTAQARQPCWSRDEWDVALNDGAVYRIFQDRDTGAWFIDAIVD
jgi:protein ImuB